MSLPRTLLVCVVAALLGGCATGRALGDPLPDGQRTKGFAEARSTRDALDSSFAPRKIAVVWGVDAFDDKAFPPLKWATNDAAEVARILGDANYGGFDRVILLNEPGQVSRDRVLAELAALKADLRRQDTLVVYASTHGTMSLDQLGEPHLYLVARDTRPSDLRHTAIELAELQRFFSTVKAERKALILDACYNGDAKSALQPTVRQRIERLDEQPTLSRKVRLGEAEAHLFASTFGRPAREDDELKHGVYTFHLLDALTWNQLEADANGDGLVTVYEAHDHARSRTVAWTTGAQVPEAYFRVVGQNDLVLVGAAEARAAKELGAIFFYGPEGDAYDGAALLVDGREKGTFPGTYSLPAGRHRVRIVGADGSVLQDRTVLITATEPLSAEGLMRQRAVHNGFLSVAPQVRFGLTAPMQPLMGRAHGGLEVAGGYRFLRGVPGLTMSAGAGYSPHQARFVDGDVVSFRPRHIGWGFAGVGYRAVLPHGGLGGGYRLRVTGLTPLDGDGCVGVPACHEWVFLSHAVVLEQAVALGDRWRLLIQEEAGVTGLDVLGDGFVKPGIDFGVRIGVEIGI